MNIWQQIRRVKRTVTPLSLSVRMVVINATFHANETSLILIYATFVAGWLMYAYTALLLLVNGI